MIGLTIVGRIIRGFSPRVLGASSSGGSSSDSG